MNLLVCNIYMKKRIIYISALVPLLWPLKSLAHCPLCTAGAGAAAVGAAWLGVGQIPIGVFIGAFAIALGLWVSKLIKRQFIPQQKWILAIFSYLTTIFPLTMMLTDVHSIYVSIFGEYGSLFNRVYVFNGFIVGSILGSIIIMASPTLSKKLSVWRKGKLIPYQGMIITFVLLFVVSVITDLSL